MKTIGYDPVLSAEVAAKGNIGVVSLDEIFKRSDFITLHTPLTDETKGLIGDASLAKCKNGVRIINCARGGIVGEQALLRGLQSGKVAGAALDVFEKEPPGDQPLFKHPRVIATPHLGASTEEAQEKVARQIAVQVADMLQERELAGAVNGEALQLALKKELKPFVLLAEKLGSLLAQLMNGQLLASVGATLAVEKINIAGLSLGRDKPGQRALTVINVDSPLTEDILRKVEKIDGFST